MQSIKEVRHAHVERSFSNRVPRCAAILTKKAYVIAIIGAAWFYVYNMLRLGLAAQDGGPDETMRALLPRCIVNGVVFPSGYDTCAIFIYNNWSYAFYPQLLPAYFSAFFMFIAKLFTSETTIIYVSGRLASVLFAVGGLFAIAQTVKLISTSNSVDSRGLLHQRTQTWQYKVPVLQLFAVILLGFWPQYTFLASYMNNDIAAICGVCILIYALCDGLKRLWRFRSCALLALGIIVGGLSYWNCYGFILVAVIVFIWSVLFQYGNNRQAWKMIVLTAAACAVCVLPWFVLNLVRYGDITGLSAFRDAQNAWVVSGNQAPQTPYAKGFKSLLFDDAIVLTTIVSFVGNLACMTHPIPLTLAFLYLGTVLMGIGMMAGHLPTLWRNHNFKLLSVALIVACLITIFLFMSYIQNIDYQLQGRYVIYLLPVLLIAFFVGVDRSYEFKNWRICIPLGLISSYWVIACVQFFAIVATNSNWDGLQMDELISLFHHATI